jgi:hypothetical protein
VCWPAKRPAGNRSTIRARLPSAMAEMVSATAHRGDGVVKGPYSRTLPPRLAICRAKCVPLAQDSVGSAADCAGQIYPHFAEQDRICGAKVNGPHRCEPHVAWLPDQGFYEDCQVLQSQLGEWPNNWWLASRSFPTPCYALKLIHSMCARAALLSSARAPWWMTYFHIDRSNVFLRTASLLGTTVGPFRRNRAQRSICLLSVLAHWYAKHLMLCTRFACCLDRCFLKAPQSRNRCASSPSPGTGALSRCASVSVEQFIDQTVPVLSVAPSGITPYST